MLQNPQETADLVSFTEEILNGKLHVLCSVCLIAWDYFKGYWGGGVVKILKKNLRVRKFLFWWGIILLKGLT